MVRVKNLCIVWVGTLHYTSLVTSAHYTSLVLPVDYVDRPIRHQKQSVRLGADAGKASSSGEKGTGISLLSEFSLLMFPHWLGSLLLFPY